MKFYSLNKKSPAVSFKEATILGQAPDKGLYFPEHVPVFDKSFFEDIRSMSNEEIAFQVIYPYVSEDIPQKSSEELFLRQSIFRYRW